jgi:hypothetical protein
VGHRDESTKRPLNLIAVGVAIAALMISPAGAHITNALHIWQDHVKPKADGRYARKVHTHDKRYVRYLGTMPAGTTARGVWSTSGRAAAAEDFADDSIAFPQPMRVAPAVHIIAIGEPTPPACRGSVTNPGARPGHLCIFSGWQDNSDDNGAHGAFDPTDVLGPPGASRFGADVYTFAAAPGTFTAAGTWAATAPRAGTAPTHRPTASTNGPLP